MDAYLLGQILVWLVIGGFVAWVIIGAVVKVIRFNVIRKRDGAEAAQLYWNKKKNSRKRNKSEGIR